ncbi:hypothetical protein M501DRAFT_920821, partial [Patellaria atrata CBS 101060]
HSNSAPRYPCHHCRKYRGINGFKCRDHLTQHLRNYHHIGESDGSFQGKSCHHQNCEHYREKHDRPWESGQVFQKSSDYHTHMRKVHDETPYPCKAPGCVRVWGKGYF